MTDVFISYARKDKAFVQVLHQALNESKYNAWVDWQDIPLTADWWAEIEAGIEAADTFIFVISPDSVESKVCTQEIDHAVANNKRLVPIVRREGFDMALVHPALGKHNWLFFKEENDFDAAFQSLIDALNTDLGYVKNHTRLLVRALEWEKKHRRDDLLLRGDDLKEAESWLEDALQVNHEPLPSEQHKNYISQSRDVEDANHRLAVAGEKAKRLVRIGAGVLAGTVAVASIIGIITQRNVVRTRKLAQIEQKSITALQQFEYQEIEALIQAMQATEELQALIGGPDQPLQDYAPHNSPWVLQQILDRIQQKNQFTNSSETSGDPAVAAVFDPSSNDIVLTNSDGSITLKTLNGEDISVLHGHRGQVWQAEFSPDGKYIASTAQDGSFRIWNRDGDVLQTFEHPAKIDGRIRFSPDGQYVAISAWGLNDILLLSLDSDLVTTIQAPNVVDFAFSPDGKTIASGSTSGAVTLWNLQGNKTRTLEGHSSYVSSITFSPDSRYLLTGSADNTAQIWDLQTDESTIIPNLDGWIDTVDFHPEGHQVAVGSSGGLARIYDLQGNLMRNLPGHSGSTDSASFNAEGTHLITASDDGYVRIWSLEEKALASLNTSVQTDPTDSQSTPNAIWNAAFSPDGQKIATAAVDGMTRIWTATGEEITQLKVPEQNMMNVVFRPDGNKLVTSTYQGNIQFWDYEGNLLQTLKLHTQRVLGLSVSPNGEWIVSGSTDGTIKVFDWEGNIRTTLVNNGDVRDVALSPDSLAFAHAAGIDGEEFVRLLDLDGNVLTELKGHADSINGISFSPDGTSVVTVSDDSTVKQWDLEGNLLHSFQRHHGRVWTVEFSPDGTSIATGGSDGYARIWDLNGNLLNEFKGHDDTVSSVNFSPDGQSLVTTSTDGTSKLWPIANTADDLLRQGCNWLEDYLVMNPERLKALKSCQQESVLKKAALTLVTQGDSLAKESKTEEAIATYRTALSWNSDLSFDAEVRTQQFTEIAQAEDLAQQGEVEAAIATIQAAVDRDPSLEIDPEPHVKQIAAKALVERGFELAETNDIEGAEAAFQEAQALDANFALASTSKAQEIAASTLVTQASEYISDEEFDQAIAKLQQVPSLALVPYVDPEDWLNICFQATLNGFAEEVLPACDRAVEVDPFPGRWRARRGFVRALAGDQEGAIEDIQAYIDWAKTTTAVSREVLDPIIQERQRWLTALENGENPFPEEEIERMKREGW